MLPVGCEPSFLFFFCIFHFLSAHPTVHMYIFCQITQGVWIDPCLAAYMNHIVMIYIYAPPDGRVCMRTDGNAWLIAFGTHNFHALLSLVFVQWRHLTRNRKLDTRQAEGYTEDIHRPDDTGNYYMVVVLTGRCTIIIIIIIIVMK